VRITTKCNKLCAGFACTAAGLKQKGEGTSKEQEDEGNKQQNVTMAGM